MVSGQWWACVCCRLLVQLEETRGQFDTFWTAHERKMRQGLHLRQFEEDFKLVSVPPPTASLALMSHVAMPTANQIAGECPSSHSKPRPHVTRSHASSQSDRW